jgi:hypothetical protein
MTGAPLGQDNQKVVVINRCGCGVCGVCRIFRKRESTRTADKMRKTKGPKRKANVAS